MAAEQRELGRRRAPSDWPRGGAARTFRGGRLGNGSGPGGSAGSVGPAALRAAAACARAATWTLGLWARRPSLGPAEEPRREAAARRTLHAGPRGLGAFSGPSWLPGLGAARSGSRFPPHSRGPAPRCGRRRPRRLRAAAAGRTVGAARGGHVASCARGDGGLLLWEMTGPPRRRRPPEGKGSHLLCCEQPYGEAHVARS
ncbi:collagen alpha-2(I) chain [Equus caballus]|uniref:collagen alpha-2(I) chain n=1 Tax=Equus caballus TaxID=9796 RepID=UPI0038B37E80